MDEVATQRYHTSGASESLAEDSSLYLGAVLPLAVPLVPLVAAPLALALVAGFFLAARGVSESEESSWALEIDELE